MNGCELKRGIVEADWSVEIGAEFPVIIVPWSDSEAGLNFVDLRGQPDAISEISEAGKYPALGAALAVLNGSGSQVFTSKCDAWRVTAEELDAMDFGVVNSEAQFAVAGYIDVVLRDAADFTSFALHENWLRRLTTELREISLPASLVEFTLRWARVEEANSSEGFATTMHVTACGADEAGALRRWEAALSVVFPLIAHGLDLPSQSSGHAGN